MVLYRNNVNVSGRGSRAMMFAHGFGCDQNMWATSLQNLSPIFVWSCSIMSAPAAPTLPPMTPTKYATLDGYAGDVVEIGRALGSKMRCSSVIRSVR